MSKTVSIVNMKGGVGKTTLSINLASALARSNDKSRMLIVDLDPQANASVYLMGRPNYIQFLESNSKSIIDIFEVFNPLSKQSNNIDNLDQVIQKLDIWWARNLDLIPSKLELSWTLKNPTGKENLLSNFLVDYANDYSFTIIDCPPTESILTTAAYLASDYILIPVVLEFLSAVGLPLLARSIGDFKKQYKNKNLEVAGIVFNSLQKNFPEHEKSKEFVKKVASENGWYIFNTEIVYSRSYATGSSQRTHIFNTGHTRDTVKNNFNDFLREFIGRIAK